MMRTESASLGDNTFAAVTSPNGIDLAPNAMYAALRTSGEWILEQTSWVEILEEKSWR